MKNLLSNKNQWYKRILFIGLFSPIITQAQFVNSDWDTISFPYTTSGLECFLTDTTNSSLFVLGGFIRDNNNAINGSYLLEYENGNLSPFANFNYSAYGATFYNSSLIVCGGFDTVNGVNVSSIAKKDSQGWSSFGKFRSDQYTGRLNKVNVIDDTLYAAGSFNTVDGDSIDAVARLVNGNWEAVYGSPFGDGIASDILKFKGDLYVSGVNVLYNGTIYIGLATYNGGSWKPVGPSYLSGSLTHVKEMVVYNDELYVLGWIQKSNGNVGNGIQKWDGTQWSEVGTGLQSVNPGYGKVQPTDMEVHNGILYVIGGFLYAGDVPSRFVATWDGNQWCSMNTSIFSNHSPTFFIGIGFLNDTLFCGFSGRIIEGNDSAYYQGIVKAPLNLSSDTCSIDFTTGITDNNLSNSNLVISPNPARTNINISFDRLPTGSIKIWVTDYSGKVVKQLRVYESTNEIPISIKGFSNGLYFVHIEINNAVQVKKLVVAH